MPTAFRVRLFVAAGAAALVVAIVLVFVTGTSDPAVSPGDATSPDAGAGDRAAIDWYRPTVDTTCQWQLQGALNTS
jgi:hypothetical protein